MDSGKNKQAVEYVVTLYGPKDDTQRGDGPPKGKNPYHLFDYQASLGQFTQEQLQRFLAEGKFSSYRTKPLCICCPHLFVVESRQEIKDSRTYQATQNYATDSSEGIGTWGSSSFWEVEGVQSNLKELAWSSVAGHREKA